MAHKEVGKDNYQKLLAVKVAIIVLFLLLNASCCKKETEYFGLVLVGVSLSFVGDFCMMWNYYVGMGFLIVARLLYIGAFSLELHNPGLATLPCILCCVLMYVARLEFKGGLFVVHVIAATVVPCHAFAAAQDNSGHICKCFGSTVLMVANILYSVSHDFGIPNVNIVSEIVSLVGHVAVMLSTLVDNHGALILPF